MRDAVIVSATRTAVGRAPNGALKTVRPDEMAAVVIGEALRRVPALEPKDVDDVIMGCAMPEAEQGLNVARIASLRAGVPVDASAVTMNRFCASGLQAIASAAEHVMCGFADIVIAGGQENMSAAPHVLLGSRDGQRMGDWKMVDTMINDGLWDAYNHYHMGTTAENVARKYDISRAEQDAFAAASHQKAEAAQKAGRFKDEIVPVEIVTRKGTVVFDTDEFIKHGTTAESLAGLKPAFDKAGSVTAGNASGLNDGAAAVLMMSASKARELGLTPLARIAAYSSAGLDPTIMGMGPVPASKRCLQKAGWTIDDLDLMEINEAFAAQACAVNKEMGWDTSKINVNGGAIALGHPIGASGARVLVTLLHEMQKRDAKKGLATLCIGGGMGIAMCVARD